MSLVRDIAPKGNGIMDSLDDQNENLSEARMQRSRDVLALMNQLPVDTRDHVTTMAYGARDALMAANVFLSLTSQDFEFALATAALAGEWDRFDVRCEGRDVIERVIKDAIARKLIAEKGVR
jgi:hypothetical protein